MFIVCQEEEAVVRPRSPRFLSMPDVTPIGTDQPTDE
jgi:hypothetical protein